MSLTDIEAGHERKPWTHYRAQIAGLARDRKPDDPELLDARRNLRTERLAEHIEAQVAAWPPLTPAQLDRLAVLLRPTVGGERVG